MNYSELITQLIPLRLTVNLNKLKKEDWKEILIERDVNTATDKFILPYKTFMIQESAWNKTFQENRKVDN